MDFGSRMLDQVHFTAGTPNGFRYEQQSIQKFRLL